MKEKFILRYIVKYDGDSPIQDEESFAEILAENFELAYEKAKILADDLRTSPNVMGVEIISLYEKVRRRTLWQKSLE